MSIPKPKPHAARVVPRPEPHWVAMLRLELEALPPGAEWNRAYWRLRDARVAAGLAYPESSNPDGPCCPRAVATPGCVCLTYWTCPDHGSRHVGTHD